MAILIAIFVLMFVFRLIYGYISTPNGVVSASYANSGLLQMGGFEQQSQSSYQRNYASQKYKGKGIGNVEATSASVVDVKYEKIATIQSDTHNFTEDEAQIRETIQSYQGLIQYEWKSGNDGYRQLNLQIGVPPVNFDALYDTLTGIGDVQARQITQTDKTNEYKKLNAQKASLEKTRTSLIELKNRDGRIDELMGLEDRILAIEQQLQDLGVSLGDFDDENEFCTIEYNLSERTPPQPRKIGLLQRIKVAFEWTVKFYLRLIAIVFFMALFALVAVKLIEKLKVVKKIINRLE